jgi:hypothetical protein
MEIKYKHAGVSLLAGSFLMVITMVLHPIGGSIEHLLKLISITIISHSIAIASVPVTLFGLIGLTKKLSIQSTLSILGFCVMFIGLIAVMCAGAINGLVLPMFLQHYADASPEALEGILPIVRYNLSLNHAFDYIYMGASCLAVFLWSIAIAKSGSIPKWIGYYGMLISVTAVATLISGFEFLTVHGFRWFIFGFVTWIVLVGIDLIRSKDPEPIRS